MNSQHDCVHHMVKRQWGEAVWRVGWVGGMCKRSWLRMSGWRGGADKIWNEDGGARGPCWEVLGTLEKVSGKDGPYENKYWEKLKEKGKKKESWWWWQVHSWWQWWCRGCCFQCWRVQSKRHERGRSRNGALSSLISGGGATQNNDDFDDVDDDE